MGSVKEFSQYRINDIQQHIQKADIQPFDMMVTGVTGAGKSTTLNSFFGKKVAKVGYGVDSETMETSSYALNNFFRIWDTPGLGDGVQKDQIHKKKMVDLLHQSYGQNYGFIDIVLVIVEGVNRDMGTTYTLLNEVIVPNIQADRIFVAINQADVAMKGRHWDPIYKRPDALLEQYLSEQATSVRQRVQETTGIQICQPIVYSAEYGYNVEKLYDMIIDHMPVEKRKLLGGK